MYMLTSVPVNAQEHMPHNSVDIEPCHTKYMYMYINISLLIIPTESADLCFEEYVGCLLKQVNTLKCDEMTGQQFLIATGR